ncbi:hypothetical protein Vretimale_9560 [Volvox reticuliferus]|uniref:Uncharacterized protein n=1 Tax=Volvox reticuliferus TaxID=1737510 RepID=A0A8J4LPW2_9CHLO|nr:hypothetical protein Vretimale_9560 [Volvox reticuliferus]
MTTIKFRGAQSGCYRSALSRSLPCHRRVATRTSAVPAQFVETTSTSDRDEAKQALRELVKFTNRGLGVRTFQRGLIEEAQVRVESFQELELDYTKLAGTKFGLASASRLCSKMHDWASCTSARRRKPLSHPHCYLADPCSR